MKISDLITRLQSLDPSISILTQDAYLNEEEQRPVRVDLIKVEDEEQAEAYKLPIGTVTHYVLY